jgi:micrococcal nuclease
MSKIANTSSFRFYPSLLVLLFFLNLGLVVSPEGLAQSKTGLLLVTKVSDGDTFWVTHPSGKEEKVRLIGINAPESRKTGTRDVQYYGKEASEYTKRLLLNKRVRLEFDVQKLDRYKRTLAYAYLESGTMLNALLVREGYARVATYPPNVRYQEQFQKLEREARSARKGLWR